MTLEPDCCVSVLARVSRSGYAAIQSEGGSVVMWTYSHRNWMFVHNKQLKLKTLQQTLYFYIKTLEIT